jgi:ribosomal protein L11 methyltransferase
MNIPWKVEIYFANPPDEDAVRDLLRPIVGELVDNTPFTTVNTKDWVANSLDGLKPVRAGRVLVHGAHDRHVVRTNDVAIEIEAALALARAITARPPACLLALDAELKKRRPRHGIDIGTGTGIRLALAKQISARSSPAISTPSRSRFRP